MRLSGCAARGGSAPALAASPKTTGRGRRRRRRAASQRWPSCRGCQWRRNQHANRAEKLAPFDRPGIVVLDARKAHRPAELLNLLNYGEQPAIGAEPLLRRVVVHKEHRALEAQDARDQIRRVHIRRAGRRWRAVERASGSSGRVVRRRRPHPRTAALVLRTPYSTRCARRRGRAKASCSRCSAV